MRYFFIALLIALLPVRGWVGDAMAVSMQANAGGTAAACPDHTAPHPAASAERTPLQAAHPMEHTQPMAWLATDSASNSDGAHPHSACDICNVPAIVVPAGVLLTLSATQPRHSSPVQTFASSELQQGVKPPIS